MEIAVDRLVAGLWMHGFIKATCVVRTSPVHTHPMIVMDLVPEIIRELLRARAPSISPDPLAACFPRASYCL